MRAGGAGLNAGAYRGALEAVDRLVNRGGDPDEVLRGVLSALHDRGVGYAAIFFVDDARLAQSLSVGDPAPATQAPVVFEGKRVGTFVASVDESSFVDRVATLISPYVLAGCDGNGEALEP